MTESVTTAAVETTVMETLPVETAVLETTVLETTAAATTPASVLSALSMWQIALLGVIAVVVIGLILWAVLRKRKKKLPVDEISVTEPLFSAQGDYVPVIAVGKLHEQGQRTSQQDSFFVSPADVIPSHGLLAVVADGMGGLSDGDRVSQTAVSAMAESFYNMKGEPMLVLLALLKQANAAVNRMLGSSGRSKSGSTLVAGLIRDQKFHYLSVGDSRICLYRGGTLYALNREHIFQNELFLRVINGEGTFHDAISHKSAAGLTSYLGMGALKYVDIPAQPVAIQPGDTFLLMSDGVYNALTTEELTVHLSKTPEDAAAAIGQAIEAKGYPTQDNYTAVILRC